MTHNWILDVLADLKKFAGDNGLNDLAKQLEDTCVVATAEVSRHGKGRLPLASGDTLTVNGRYTGTA